MKLDELGKVLHNVELKLKGRIALVALGVGAMLVALWLLLRDFAIHPTFSMICCSGILLAMLALLLLVLLGKATPDENAPKSVVLVEHLGVAIVQGIGSQQDLIQVLRTVIGPRKLPHPSFVVKGSAKNSADYVPLNSAQSEAIADQIENSVAKLLGNSIEGALSDNAQQNTPTTSPQEPGEDSTELIKGKAITPKE